MVSAPFAVLSVSRSPFSVSRSVVRVPTWPLAVVSLVSKSVLAELAVDRALSRSVSLATAAFAVVAPARMAEKSEDSGKPSALRSAMICSGVMWFC